MSEATDREALSKLIRKRGNLDVQIADVTEQIEALKKTMGWGK